MKQGTKTALRILLNVINSAGTIGTGYLAAKEAPSANENLEKLKAEKGEAVTKIDILKCTVKSYAPAIAVGGLSIASNVCSAIISKKTEASLMAGMALLGGSYTKYKGKVKEVIGKVKENEIVHEIMKDDIKHNPEVLNNVRTGNKLYWQENIGFFECNPELFWKSVDDLQLLLADPDSNGYVSLKEWVDLMDADVKDRSVLPELDKWGWGWEYLSDVHNTQILRIHEDCTDETLEKRGAIQIIFEEDPIYDFYNFDLQKYDREHGRQ